MHKVQFICQREQDVFPEDSCHVACLHMLLKFIHFSPMPTYDDLCKSLNLFDECSTSLYDTSIEEILKFVVREKINFRIVFRQDDWEAALDAAPIMVAMYGSRRFWGHEGHTIVLTQFKNDIFTYLDPWFPSSTGRHIKKIDKTAFYQYYLGFACQLLP